MSPVVEFSVVMPSRLHKQSGSVCLQGRYASVDGVVSKEKVSFSDLEVQRVKRSCRQEIYTVR